MASERVEALGPGRWDARVQFGTDGGGGSFAYRPNQLITVRRALRHLASLLGQDVATGTTEEGPNLRKVAKGVVRSPWE